MVMFKMKFLLTIAVFVCIIGYVLTRHSYLNGRVHRSIAMPLIFLFMFIAVLLVFYLASPFRVEAAALEITSAIVVALGTAYGTYKARSIISRGRDTRNK